MKVSGMRERLGKSRMPGSDGGGEVAPKVLCKGVSSEPRSRSGTDMSQVANSTIGRFLAGHCLLFCIVQVGGSPSPVSP